MGPRKLYLLKVSQAIQYKVGHTHLICRMGTVAHRAVVSVSYLNTCKVSSTRDIKVLSICYYYHLIPLPLGPSPHPLRLSSLGSHTSRDGRPSAFQDGPSGALYELESCPET